MLGLVWLLPMFVLGVILGSFLNVCIARLPLEKSILWPTTSRCGHCLQAIRWKDNLPLVSYLLLRGRCRSCGTRFSPRYLFVELLTGIGFAGLFYLEVILNVHHFDIIAVNQGAIMDWGVIPWQGWVVVGQHAVLFCFLLVAACCDLEHRDIPLSLTATGTVIGLLTAVLWPWPWPYTPAQATAGMLPGKPWYLFDSRLWPKQGLYPWPFWGPLPDWCAPGGDWLTGLMTGLVGLLVGTLMLRAVRFLFGTGMGVEALGLGDADLMMMAGSFLGWQPVVVAFFVAVFPALVFGVIQLILSGDNAIPFGPSLAAGVFITSVAWYWIAPPFSILFFNELFLLVVCILSGAFMFLAALLLRARQKWKS